LVLLIVFEKNKLKDSTMRTEGFPRGALLQSAGGGLCIDGPPGFNHVDMCVLLVVRMFVKQKLLT
jgi:hypothetical protein